MKRLTTSALGRTAIAAALVALSACSDETTGLEAVDLAGDWVATKYEFTDRTTVQQTVDLIARDGVMFDVSIEESGRVTLRFVDGVGALTTEIGTLRSWVTGSGRDEQAHAEITTGARTYLVGVDGDALVLVDADRIFEPRPGVLVPATLRAELLPS
ncbi:MAG: hypothetical protein AAF389_06940 [Gemmatimonadota bacterium]